MSAEPSEDALGGAPAMTLRDDPKELATRVESGGRRLRRPSPVRLRTGPRTIQDTPEDEAGRRSLLETTLAGWTGSVIFHAALVLLLILLAVLVPDEPAKVVFDVEAGSSLGSEEGLDRLGGFDDDLSEVFQEDPTALALEPLLAPIAAPALELDTRRLLDDATRSGEDGSTGVGGGEFGIARFGEGLETIRGVEVRVGDPQFTLIWDTEADIDLHVIEPGGSHIFWMKRRGERGGELDVDDTDGFGPENVYWPEQDSKPGNLVKGQGPPGVYHWYVHYYGTPGGFGGRAVPTRWKVRIKHAGQVTLHEGVLRRVNQRSNPESLRLGKDNDA